MLGDVITQNVALNGMSSQTSKSPLGRKRSWIASSFENSDDKRDKKSNGLIGNKSSRQICKSNTSKIINRRHVADSLWVDKYQPRNKAELLLAINKRKVTEVEDWLRNCITHPDEPSILLLTGSSGVGKTTTIRILADDLKLEIKEWINPITNAVPQLADDNVGGRIYDAETYESQLSLFWQFLLRANKYESLSFVNETQCPRRLVLVEDFPNVFPQKTDEFHSILRRFSQTSKTPAVFILNDNNKVLNARSLFPQDLQNALKIATIAFNAITDNNLLKVITTIAACEISPIPDKTTLGNLAAASSGDVRIAINTLQFSYFKDDKNTKSNSKTPSNKRANQPVDGAKDSTLYLFRAIGRVLYSKRSRDLPSDGCLLPPHLQSMARSPLISEPESIVHNASISPECLHLFLHQNYLKFFSDFSDVVRASAYLSDSDMLTSEWASKGTLEECAALVAVRGLMHSNTKVAAPTWTPLHKPYWYTAHKVQQQRKNQLGYWSREFNITNANMLTEILPYCSKIPHGYKSNEAVNFYKELTSSQGSYNRCQEDRLFDAEFLEFDENDTEGQDVCAPADVINYDNEDDVVIEEYSD